MQSPKIDCVIGLDISTSIIGVAVLSADGSNLLVMDHIKLSDIKGLFAKADAAIEKLAQIVPTEHYNVKGIFVEANAKMFSAGKTTADVLFALAKINALVSYLSQKLYGAAVHDVNVVSARSAIGYKDNRAVKKPVKEKVRKFVMDKFPNLPVKTHVVTRGKNKGQTAIDEGVADEVDAFVIAYGGFKHVKASNTP